MINERGVNLGHQDLWRCHGIAWVDTTDTATAVAAVAAAVIATATAAIK